jgi:MFS family permease
VLSLPKNIYVMSLVMSLSFTTTAMMVLVAGLLGASIAPDPSLATLPIAMTVVATAIATIPAAMIMQAVGRKKGMAIGILIALTGSGLAYYAAIFSQFWLFIAGSMCFGFNAAFVQQGRFIILENAIGEKQQADGLTLALMANLFAAFLGPQLGAYGRDLVASPAGFAGSFILAAGVLITSMFALTFYQSLAKPIIDPQISKRPLRLLLKQPTFILAAGSAAIGYGVMSLVMTATPISMHEIAGHSLDNTKLVIQTHIIAMFLPSMLTGKLLKLGYRSSLLFAGLVLYIVVSIIGFGGVEVIHYWWALLLLGLGWNLLFVTSTAILPSTYNDEERFKAQAANDFLIFSVQAIAAFAAGWLLFNWGWASLLKISVLITLAWGLILLSMRSKLSWSSAGIGAND